MKKFAEEYTAKKEAFFFDDYVPSDLLIPTLTDFCGSVCTFKSIYSFYFLNTDTFTLHCTLIFLFCEQSIVKMVPHQNIEGATHSF